MSSRAVLDRIEPAFDALRHVIRGCALLAGVAIFVMIGVTVVDVVLRIFGSGIVGAYDVVRICGVVTIACGLPYVTAVKGHIAIEFFYQGFSRAGRIVLDTLFRITAIALFGFLMVKNIEYGLSLEQSGEVMPTLRLPVFWIPFVISFNSALVVIVVVYHLLHPGKEMIKP